MAALVVSAVGSAVAGSLGSAVTAWVGNALFGSGDAVKEGPRLADLDVMASSEGAPVPRVYGRARLAGQVIWATQLEEVATPGDDGAGGKGFGSGPSTTTGTYTYFANFAVGLCDGVIGRVGRIWADGKLLDTEGINWRVYRGTEDQMPDGLIVAKEGAGQAPAYRGLAYVVFERLPLANFGNRIPQLSFEIIRPIGLLEQMTRAVTLIPGTTEFGYEPQAVVQVLGPGVSAQENRHVGTARSDVVAALDDLQGMCPNLQRVAIVVTWFGSDLRAGNCVVRPGVENLLKVTSALAWSANGVVRPSAYVVSQVGGRPAFGGTPSDDSVVHLIAELKARGLKVTLYPFVIMDVPAGNTLTDPWSGATSQPAYPWRGHITCHPAPGQPGSPDGTAAAAAQVANFFTGGVWNYRRMVLHYAQLAATAGGVEAFLIGSELRGLTRVRSAPGVYPAVEHLVSLAAEVKALVGAGTVVTYGADWTEYGAHVVDADASEVRFPLDPLWASPAIDAVGIDYYAPLSDWRDTAGHLDQAAASSIYDSGYLRGNITAGEGFDWYYANDAARDAQDRSAITDGLGKPWMFRAKDLANWWSQPHVERSGHAELGVPTAWTPRSKPIWLTEVGCPAVDKGANQPSVFPDPKSSENFVPYYSNGTRDDLIQRRMLEAVLSAFDPWFGGDDVRNPPSPLYGGRMIDVSAIHLWTWDSRPYPVFPAAEDIWSDGAHWHTGHWLNGRLGSAPLDALVAALAGDAGASVDASALTGGCDGYVVDRPMAPRAMIAPLAAAYAFDATAADGTLRFVPRGGAVVAEFGEDDLVVPDDGAPAQVVRAQETELPVQVGIGFSDALADYRRAAVTSRKLTGGASGMLQADLAVIASDAQATQRAEIWLQDLWAGRERAEFGLGRRALALAPGDVVGLTLNGRRKLFEIDALVDTQSRQVGARGIDPDVFAVALQPPRIRQPAIPLALGPVQVVALDLPVIDDGQGDVLTRLAVFANPWPGGVAIWQSGDGASFQVAAAAAAPAVVGVTLDALPAGPPARWDQGNSFRVRLSGGALASLSDARVFSGGNAAAVQNADGGWEIIQFARAELVDGQADGRVYRLSRLLRGQGGSEPAMAALLPAGATVVLLDDRLRPIARGPDALERPLSLRAVATGRNHDDAAAVALTVTPSATALRPLAPVHVKAARRADGVHLGWIRRTRIGGDGWSGEVPLGEDSEAYRVDVVSGGVVVRSIASATPQALYAAADEIADFGAPQTMLHLRVMQLSATVGAGAAADMTLQV